jgi:hypothetical protein
MFPIRKLVSRKIAQPHLHQASRSSTPAARAVHIVSADAVVSGFPTLGDARQRRSIACQSQSRATRDRQLDTSSGRPSRAPTTWTTLGAGRCHHRHGATSRWGPTRGSQQTSSSISYALPFNGARCYTSARAPLAAPASGGGGSAPSTMSTKSPASLSSWASPSQLPTASERNPRWRNQQLRYEIHLF